MRVCRGRSLVNGPRFAEGSDDVILMKDTSLQAALLLAGDGNDASDRLATLRHDDRTAAVCHVIEQGQALRLELARTDGHRRFVHGHQSMVTSDPRQEVHPPRGASASTRRGISGSLTPHS